MESRPQAAAFLSFPLAGRSQTCAERQVDAASTALVDRRIPWRSTRRRPLMTTLALVGNATSFRHQTGVRHLASHASCGFFSRPCRNTHQRIGRIRNASPLFGWVLQCGCLTALVAFLACHHKTLISIPHQDCGLPRALLAPHAPNEPRPATLGIPIQSPLPFVSAVDRLLT